MNNVSTNSLWMTTVSMPKHVALAEDTEADVVVVGAGIAGLTTAYLLARRKRSVVVLDAGSMGSGETRRTTAHLSTALDDRYVNLEKLHGRDSAFLAAESHRSAIMQIEELVQSEQIDCSFERLDGWLYAPAGEPKEIIDEELAACHRAGLLDVEKMNRVPGLGFDTGACLRFPRQAQFHPLRYLRAIALAAEDLGVRVFTGTRVMKFEGGKDARVHTAAGYSVRAKAIVVATNTPVNDLITMHTKQAAYRSYVVGMKIPKRSVPRLLLWDTLDPYHYVRIHDGATDDHDVVIVGGEDHKTGQAADAAERHGRLEAWARGRFAVTETLFRWSGQVMEPNDGMAFIGRNPGDHDNVFIATGDSGNGMTHGTIAGMLLTDLITDVASPWAELYDPARKRGAVTFLKENLNVAAQYAHWVMPGDVARAENVERGTGQVVRRGLSPIAVYCDSEGRRHECSAVCPHLGAVLTFNASEGTWDCPAHGSRFTIDGKPVNGPANSPLSRVKDKPKSSRRRPHEAPPEIVTGHRGR